MPVVLFEYPEVLWIPCLFDIRSGSLYGSRSLNSVAHDRFHKVKGFLTGAGSENCRLPATSTHACNPTRARLAHRIEQYHAFGFLTGFPQSLHGGLWASLRLAAQVTEQQVAP